MIADRIDNRRFIIFSECLYLTSAGLMGLLTLTGLIQLWQISALLLLHGIAGGISQPSRQKLVHQMVGRDRLLSAISLNSSLRQSTLVLGPAIGGLLLATLGAGVGYLVNAATFLPLIAVLARMRLKPEPPRLGTPAVWREFREGLAYTLRHPTLAALIALVTIEAFFVGNALYAMLPVFADRILGVGPWGYSLLLTLHGVGAILGGGFLAWRGNVRRQGRLIALTVLAFPVAVVVFSASTSFALSLLMILTIGVVLVIANTCVNTLVQLMASDDMRGRVLGVHTMGTLGVRVVNGLSVGLLASVVSAPFALSVSALVVGALSIAVLLHTPAVLKLEA